MANDDLDEAAALLHDAVVNCKDFLVPHACKTTTTYAQYVKSRFSAAKWVEGFTLHDETYHTLLARAFLLTPGLEVPDEEIDDDAFLRALQAEAGRIVRRKQPPTEHNFHAVRDHPIAGPVLQQVEDEFPYEYVRYLCLYEVLLRTIMVGLPPVHIVDRFCGDEAMEEYKEHVEWARQLAQLDVDQALERGVARSKRKEDVWNARDAHRVVSVLGILCNGHRRGLAHAEIGEQFQRYRKQETARKNSEQRHVQDTARDLGVWRIRRSQAEKWRQSLSTEDWAAYQACEQAMRATAPFAYIPRRHHSPGSVRAMQTTNLPRLRALYA